jgi:hypothetical protein
MPCMRRMVDGAPLNVAITPILMRVIGVIHGINMW